MPNIPWRPRVILPGRNFRLPVQATDDNIALEADHFETIATRWCERDTARYYYLRSPQKQGDYTLIATHSGNIAETTIQVRTLDNLRQPHTYNGAQWPRRWPLGQNYQPTKTRQTLQNDPKSEHLNEKTLAYWSSQPDHVLWSQLPPAELPKAHFANCHQGCPNCGTAIFKYSGFYPWLRNHLPCDFKSKCPHCAFVYPSNDLTNEDYISGEHADDGYGYFDAEGHIYLFAATYHRDQCRAYHAGINALTDSLRAGDRDEERTRKLGLMLLRYATEELYLASVPQFRYGPSKSVEEPWEWGQPDWAEETDPVAALSRKGSIRYSIDIEGLQDIAAGDRITINPDGRAHSYRIEAAEQLDTHIHRLTLDVTSILGRAKIIAIEDNKIDLGFHIMAKSGNLHGTRLQTETSYDWAVIANAQNASIWPPGKIRTTIYLDLNNNKLQNLSPGTWVQAVDYVIGDPVLFEPLCRG